VVGPSVPVDQRDPRLGEPFKVLQLARIDRVVDDARDHDASLGVDDAFIRRSLIWARLRSRTLGVGPFCNAYRAEVVTEHGRCSSETARPGRCRIIGSLPMRDEAMRIPAFVRYWTASTTGAFGTAVSVVAVQVLVVQVLVASPMEVGVVNAARVLPYAFLGLFAGVLVDRVRRKPLLVWSNAAQAVALLAIPVLWLADALTLVVVAAVLFVVVPSRFSRSLRGSRFFPGWFRSVRCSRRTRASIRAIRSR
jgi:hypothetical protein